MRMSDRVLAWWHGARDYRYEGEREAHEQQLRETQISLSLMSSAELDGGSQQRMGSEIEDGAENQLTVLLGKPRLSLAEKRTRDAIQLALSQRRQSFAALNQPTAPPQLARGFLGAIPAVAGIAVRPWMLWSGVLAAVALWGGYNDVRAGQAINERDEARAELANTERDLIAANAERDLLREAAADADAQSQQAAATIEAERARRLRAERESRSIRNEMEQARAGGPVSYGFDGVRNAEPDN